MTCDKNGGIISAPYTVPVLHVAQNSLSSLVSAKFLTSPNFFIKIFFNQSVPGICLNVTLASTRSILPVIATKKGI